MRNTGDSISGVLLDELVATSLSALEERPRTVLEAAEIGQ